MPFELPKKKGLFACMAPTPKLKWDRAEVGGWSVVGARGRRSVREGGVAARKEEGGRKECLSLSASEQGEMCRHRHRATCWAEVAEGRAEVVVVVVVVVVGSALARAGASSLHHSERHVTAAGARAEGCATAPREETTDRQIDRQIDR